MIAGGFLASSFIPLGMDWMYALIMKTRGWTEQTPPFDQPYPRAATFVFGALFSGVLGTYLVAKVQRLILRWEVMTNADKVTLFVGVLVGVGLSIPFRMLLFAFDPSAVAGSFLLMLALIAVSIAVLRGMQDTLPWSRLPVGRRGQLKIFDTNVIIDGRIYEVAKTGFLEGKFYVPQFVLDELQLVADSHDPNKRQRGRRGLDMLRNLQNDLEIDVGTKDHLAGDSEDPVDTRLIRLAKTIGGQLITNDFNLNKVAQVQGVPVLNINDLAMAVKPSVLPMDIVTVLVERNGSHPGQGVGFLDDGTMVVIEHGEEHKGKRLDVRITQVHQSAAGRMIFADIEKGDVEGAENERRRERT